MALAFVSSQMNIINEQLHDFLKCPAKVYMSRTSFLMFAFRI